VRYIRAEHGDAFCISVAGFPGGHPETGDSEEGRQQEMQWLKEKVEAGADFIFTQMFYDVELFLAWVRRVRAAGITVPIVPGPYGVFAATLFSLRAFELARLLLLLLLPVSTGIMPIQSMSIFNKWVSRENIQVPQHFYDALNPVKDDDAQVRAVGTKLVGEMCKRIITSEEGIRGLHIYTLNLAVGARMLLEEVGLVPTVEIVNPLPWTPVSRPSLRSCTFHEELT
jgi:methylenetetrahydrofolate reductase (NADPH)